MLLMARELKKGDTVQVQRDGAPPGTGVWRKVDRIRVIRETVTYEAGGETFTVESAWGVRVRWSMQRR